MAETVADAFVNIRPEGSGFGSDLGGIMRGASGTALKAGAVLGTAALAGLAGAFKIGDTFDNAFDAIRIGTGATGEALEGLKGDFRAVATSVPASLGDVGTAIADLNTRTGQSGKGLQNLAKQTLELARLTESDLGSTIANTTRLFGDWSVKTKGQSETLDQLFRAAQATGSSIDSLSSAAVQYGAPMRELGFSFEETIAMLGSFEKAGVNTALVMGGMRQGLGRLAKEGKDPRAVMDALAKSIDKSGLTAANKTKAFEIFGARAGIDMAKAMEEGRFSVDDLVATIKGGSDTISKAAADTADFAEKWTLFKNRVLLAIEPIAMRVFDAVGRGMDYVSGIFDTFQREGLSGVVSSLQATISGALPVIWANLREWGAAFVEWVTPMIPPMLAKAGELLATLGNWIVDTALPWIGDKLVEWGTAFGTWIIDAMPGMFQSLLDLLTALGDWIIEKAPAVAEKLGEWAATLVVWVINAIPKLIENLGKMLDSLIAWITGTASPDTEEASDGVAASFMQGLEDGIGDRMPELRRKLQAMLREMLKEALTIRGKTFTDEEAGDIGELFGKAPRGASGGRSFEPAGLPKGITRGATINITTLGRESPRETAAEQVLALQRASYTGGLQW